MSAPPQQGDDLFSAQTDPGLSLRLAHMDWPDSGRYPVNHARAHVGDQVWSDLTASRDPLVVTGYASIAQIIELAWEAVRGENDTTLRLVLGNEPFTTSRVLFTSNEATFTDDVRGYWLERGISVLLSAKVVHAIDAMDAGRLQVRFHPGRPGLHAKIYVGDDAATLGSSNFTRAGLRDQFEANARWARHSDASGYDSARRIAENYWDAGSRWDAQMRELLSDLLRVVTWQEALARACADLLEGEWASAYLGSHDGIARLWPSQVAGIAEAMWVVENVGSVLVADATGSGKTRMGAHLTRAVRDRMWSTGRVRGDLTVLVSPPAVAEAWQREAIACGLTMVPVSHGLLSRKAADGPRAEEDAVAQAQILAVDEAHNFLSPSSNRSRQVRSSTADHVLLFTATPINRGSQDLLSLVDHLGADNFDDEALAVLDRLARARRTGSAGDSLEGADRDILKREIQKFTVRRTKTALNRLVDRSPDDYRDAESGRVARYPRHRTHTYATGENEEDCAVADEIRTCAAELLGVGSLGRDLRRPSWYTRTSEEWLRRRLGAARGLVAHRVRSAMRSSQAALLEHVVGTTAAVELLQIHGFVKQRPSGDMLANLRELRQLGRPEVDLDCALPPWLLDDDGWRDACDHDIHLYEQIRAQALVLGNRREQAKAATVTGLAQTHARVLAFDHHPITLAVIGGLLDVADTPVLVASGGDHRARQQVRKAFSRDAVGRAIALCSDAMNEGINLQGASAVIQFDLPTTLRVAEQRVGRVDRMDSPYDEIDVWWPKDTPSFATRAADLLAARNEESASLLGSNLQIPGNGDEIITPEFILDQVRERGAEWDGLHDALDPVRGLVSGDAPLISAATYEGYRQVTQQVVARVSAVRSSVPWALFAIRGAFSGAPRWLLLEGPPSARVAVTGLDAVVLRLRDLLADNPQGAPFDEACATVLTGFLHRAAEEEVRLLPRRHQRALEQMRWVCRDSAGRARRGGAFDDASRWDALAGLTLPALDDVGADLHQVADLWLKLVKPYVVRAAGTRRNRSYSRLSDIDPLLRGDAPELDFVESSMSALTATTSVEQRVSACILGVP